jgi:hypothetical protein
VPSWHAAADGAVPVCVRSAGKTSATRSATESFRRAPKPPGHCRTWQRTSWGWTSKQGSTPPGLRFLAKPAFGAATCLGFLGPRGLCLDRHLSASGDFGQTSTAQTDRETDRHLSAPGSMFFYEMRSLADFVLACTADNAKASGLKCSCWGEQPTCRCSFGATLVGDLHMSYCRTSVLFLSLLLLPRALRLCIAQGGCQRSPTALSLPDPRMPRCAGV